MKRFAGKAVLITGAASGIALATAERLAREGAQVLACDINAELLEKSVASLRNQGLDVTVQVLDVTDSADCNAAVAEAVTRFGKLDVLCNSAGTLAFKNFAEFSDSDWARVMNININGVFAMCRAAIPHLLASKGNIVNLSSATGIVGAPYNAAYCTSKGAVLMLSKALAVEYAARGVRVNAVCPGHVLTPMTSGMRPPADADLAIFGRLTPLVQPSAQPAEIANAIAYLASDEARFVTGATFVIDGGQTAI